MVFPGSRVSPLRLLKPTLQMWSHASPTRGGAHTDSGEILQHDWTDKEARKHINWLELRAARLKLLHWTSPGHVVQLHLDNMTAITFIRKIK